MIGVSHELRLLALAILILAQPVMAVTIRAQDATPDATPVAVKCDVPARPVVFIADLLAQPEPELVPTVVTDLPVGQPVDDATRSQVITVVQTLITCVNQGDFLRSFYWFDDEYLRRIIDPDGLMAAEVAVELGKTFATPAAVNPQEISVLVEVISVERLDDGSVVIVFRTQGGAGRSSDDEQVDLFVLRQIGPEWKIVDGLSDIELDQ